MNAALLSLGSVSSHWTADAMNKHFDSVDSLDIRKLEINMGSKRDAQLAYDGKSMKQYDCVYAKGSFRYASLLRAVTNYMHDTTFLPIKDDAFTLIHNKILTHIVLQQNNIPMPITYLTTTTAGAKQLLENINYPIVMKFPEGTQGKGVMFADSFAGASSLLDALQALKQPFIIQEYIETGSSDIRAIVVGDKVVASMQRIAVHGEKRANIHAGAVGEAIELDTHTKKIAVKAARVLGAEICGVDILAGVRGPLVIELNLSPGLQGIKKATGVDVASHIAKFLYKRTKEFRKKDIDTSKSKIMEDLGISASKEAKEIVTNLDIRSERILLPEFVTRMGRFDENNEVLIKMGDKKVTIEKLP